METYKLADNKTLEVTQDEYPNNPRHDDNISTMICFHNRYSLGDKHTYKHQDYSGWAEMEKAIIENEKPAIILPLYLYDHSGITISTTPFSCKWDSGQIGFVFISKEKLRNELIEENKEGKKKYITKKHIERATKNILAELETYDLYLRGEVYGYTLINENGEIEDSCFGYYGVESILDEFGINEKIVG
jgi:hypothetical protein